MHNNTLFACLIGISLTCLSPAAEAQFLLRWNTTANTGLETLEPSVSNGTGVSPSNLELGTGIAPASNANRFGGNNFFDTGDPSPTTFADAVSDAEYIEFDLTVLPGFSATVTELNFIFAGSSTGPSALTLTYSVDGFASSLASATGVNVDRTSAAQLNPNTAGNFTVLNFTDLTVSAGTTTFRLYGHGATATSGSGGFDTATGATTPNVNLLGTVTAVPEPSTWIGGALAITAISFLQRRRFAKLLARRA